MLWKFGKTVKYYKEIVLKFNLYLDMITVSMQYLYSAPNYFCDGLSKMSTYCTNNGLTEVSLQLSSFHV